MSTERGGRTGETRDAQISEKSKQIKQIDKATHWLTGNERWKARGDLMCHKALWAAGGVLAASIIAAGLLNPGTWAAVGALGAAKLIAAGAIGELGVGTVVAGTAAGLFMSMEQDRKKLETWHLKQIYDLVSIGFYAFVLGGIHAPSLTLTFIENVTIKSIPVGELALNLAGKPLTRVVARSLLGKFMVGGTIRNLNTPGYVTKFAHVNELRAYGNRLREELDSLLVVDPHQPEPAASNARQQPGGGQGRSPEAEAAYWRGRAEALAQQQGAQGVAGPAREERRGVPQEEPRGQTRPGGSLLRRIEEGGQQEPLSPAGDDPNGGSPLHPPHRGATRTIFR